MTALGDLLAFAEAVRKPLGVVLEVRGDTWRSLLEQYPETVDHIDDPRLRGALSGVPVRIVDMVPAWRLVPSSETGLDSLKRENDGLLEKYGPGWNHRDLLTDDERRTVAPGDQGRLALRRVPS